MNHAIVSREEWLDARKALLAKERAMTHELDALRAERRQLPWVKIEKPYVFEGPEGECTLGDLFRGRSQLAIYHFMLTPGSDNVCRGCSFIADHVDAARQHFEHADLSFAAVSRVPLRRIEEVKAPDGLDIPLGLLARQRLQLRFRRVVHARGPRRRPRDLQLRRGASRKARTCSARASS